MAKVIFKHSYNDIISLNNLLEAWKEFICGKRSRIDVQIFERDLMTNIFLLHNELIKKEYQHSRYEQFKIFDPKSRDIHKATVRDRLLHRAIYRVLYPYFDKKFIHDSYSCRYLKGAHRAINRFKTFAGRVSHNHRRTCWVLKCDVRKFFASVDHKILMKILERHICDKDIIWLVGEIVGSFQSTEKGKGLPLGNLTSQLLANIYMNELDQFIKHGLRQRYYIRYADDFVIMHENIDVLMEILPKISEFLERELLLTLHPDKIFIKTVASGVDFLGWVHFPDHRVLRTSTKNRMFRKIKEVDYKPTVVRSYLGLLSHGNSWYLRQDILEEQ